MLRGDLLDQLLNLMNNVYVPVALTDHGWPDNVRKEFTSQVQKFMSTVTEMTHMAKGKTVLYIPQENSHLPCSMRVFVAVGVTVGGFRLNSERSERSRGVSQEASGRLSAPSLTPPPSRFRAPPPRKLGPRTGPKRLGSPKRQVRPAMRCSLHQPLTSIRTSSGLFLWKGRPQRGF